MKKIIKLIAVLLLSLPAFAEEVNTYRPEIGKFDKLRVFDNINVVYRCVPDSAGQAVFKATDEFADAFIFTNSKGTLTLQLNSEDVGKPGLPTVYLYSDFLTFVENSSVSTITVSDLVSVPSFKAKQIGNGKIVINGLQSSTSEIALTTGNGSIIVSGQCEDTLIRMLGTGVIQADDLKSDIVKCKIMGSGTIGCWAVSDLESRGIGSTKIYYKGNPVVKKVGGGKLIPMDSIESDNITEEAESKGMDD